jgi:hypothetical protein
MTIKPGAGKLTAAQVLDKRLQVSARDPFAVAPSGCACRKSHLPEMTAYTTECASEFLRNRSLRTTFEPRLGDLPIRNLGRPPPSWDFGVFAFEIFSARFSLQATSSPFPLGRGGLLMHRVEFLGGFLGQGLSGPS